MMPSSSFQQADALLKRVLLGGTDDEAHELLRAFWAGYPVDRLRLLLRGEEADAIRAGVWIASELGAAAAPLLGELTRLLRHRLKYVRFFAVDAVLASASSHDAKAVGEAVKLIEDPEDAVRWKVLGLLARGSREQLSAAIPAIEEPGIATRLSWLLSREAGLEGVVAKLEGDHLDRMFAAAAAVRLDRGRRQALQRAAGSADEEVRTFAQEELQRSVS